MITQNITQFVEYMVKWVTNKLIYRTKSTTNTLMVINE